MKIIRDDSKFRHNGYMIGLCPRCEDWEAPITERELKKFKSNKAHVGSSMPVVDSRAKYYHRLIWKEYFECPKCQKKFSVEYSNV